MMAALSLMSARKFIQAIEKFRKAQVLILESRDISDDLKNLTCFIELLCADCMGQHSLQAEKVDSFKRLI